MGEAVGSDAGRRDRPDAPAPASASPGLPSPVAVVGRRAVFRARFVGGAFEVGWRARSAGARS